MIKERIVPIQFQEALLKEIENYIKQGLYSSKAEFIREAVRIKIIDLRKQLFFNNIKELKEIIKLRGQKIKTPFLTNKQKDEVFNDIKKSTKS